MFIKLKKWNLYLKKVVNQTHRIIYLYRCILFLTPLRKICENTGFGYAVFSRTILSLFEKLRVCKNPYSSISYAVFTQHQFSSNKNVDIAILSESRLFFGWRLFLLGIAN